MNRIEKMPDKIESALTSKPVILKYDKDGFLGKKHYSIISRRTGYRYYGKIKDNKPDGFGVLASGEVDLNDVSTVKNLIYAGNFSEGLFNGYGASFNSETVKIYAGAFVVDVLLEPKYETIADLYFARYVTYDGDWKNGEQTGKANSFNLPNNMAFQPAQGDYWGRVCYPIILVTEFKKGTASGNMKQYDCGVLTYDGQVKRNVYWGEGTSYFLNGQRYEGQWKYGLYHGKGKLYDENGKLIYSGNWKKGDYAS